MGGLRDEASWWTCSSQCIQFKCHLLSQAWACVLSWRSQSWASALAGPRARLCWTPAGASPAAAPAAVLPSYGGSRGSVITVCASPSTLGPSCQAEGRVCVCQLIQNYQTLNSQCVFFPYTQGEAVVCIVPRFFMGFLSDSFASFIFYKVPCAIQ